MSVQVVFLGAALMITACVSFPALAQQEKVDAATGQYVQKPDKFSQDWPQPDANGPNPNSLTRNIAQPQGRSGTPTGARARSYVAPDPNAGLVPLGGMTLFDPAQTTSNPNAYPNWWPQ